MAGHNNWPYIINLGNSIIGVAILAMPFCFKQCGILLAMLVLLFCTWLTLASCQLLMKAGIVSRRRSYEFLAYFTHGATGKFLSEVGMIGMQVGTLIAQIVVIGDLGPAIISKLIGIENSSNLRTCLIILLCLCIGLPLGLLKDLRAVSRASTVCISFYSVFVLYVLFLSLPNLWAGSWYPHVHFWRPEGLFQCLPILSFSFGCQTQLFLLYDALPEPSLKSISSVISSAVNLCAVAYLLVGFIGYVTFYAVEIPGDILAIFPNTLMADLMKLCFCFSIVITFPVIIFPCRASIYTLVFSKKTKLHDDSIEGEMFMSENLFKGITISIVLGSMITGILIPNVEFILGINGAIVGTLICYIFPALFFLKVMETKSDGKVIAKLVFVLGITILLLSTFATLNSQNKGHSHIEPAKDVLDVDKLGVGEGVGLTKPALEKPLDESNQNLKRDLGANGDAINVEKKDIDTIDDQRKEPPIPDPPDSVEIETKRKKNGSLKDPKLKQDIDNVKNDAENKQKELEAEKKAKESQETEKKQEELLGKLEKHREEQEKLLKEQRELLKELKDHQEDHKDQQEEKQAEKVAVEFVHKDIVDKQQKIINQQQKVIEQQQEQLNQQKNINIPPAQIPRANPQVQQNQQQELNQQVHVNLQQPLPNQQVQMNQQQPFPNKQAQMNQQQPVPNQQAQMNQQQPLPNQQAQMNQQQPLPNQQAQMNQQQPLPNQLAQMNPQQPVPNQQVQMKQQQPLPNQAGQINLQQPILNQQAQQQPFPNQQAQSNRQPPLPNQQAEINQQQPLPNQQVNMNQQAPLPNQQANMNQQPPLPNQQTNIKQQPAPPNQQANINQQPPLPNQMQMNQQQPLLNQQAQVNQQPPLPNQQIHMNQQQPLLNQQAQVNQKLMENQQAQVNQMANENEQLNQQKPLLNQQAQMKQ